jgi:hypothetical protein
VTPGAAIARGGRWRLVLVASGVAVAAAALAAPPALGAFPYARPGADTKDYTDLYLTDQEPNDVGDDSDGEYFKYSASPLSTNVTNNGRPTELGGVRGGHLFDKDAALPTAWQVTTGRPDVTIATLDSGIEWNNSSAMNDLRFKTRLNEGELPIPQKDRSTPLVAGVDCTSYLVAYDANDDGVLNIADYACDSRVNVTDSRRVGPAGVLTPQDILIAFSNGDDADSNGYVDDIVGWDFLDDDNDPFDDVQYGHGTGEAEGSSGEADNGSTIGSCPNCMVIHMRVGDSFIADVNRFAEAVIYATDNGALVIQEALGTLNNSSHARQAVNYAYEHGVTTIASAADEAAQHNNWPSSLPHVILVNSVTRSPIPPPDQSYLAFNGCTNFNSKVTLAIPSTSCSSDATGVGSGMAGIVYSAALTAHDEGVLPNHPTCKLATDGPDPGSDPDPCVISANEVRQIMASGTRDGQLFPDDIDFAGDPPQSGNEPSCTPPLPGCTDPKGPGGLLQDQVYTNRPVLIPDSFSYLARNGHDQFYGYGRVNVNRTVRTLLDDPATPSSAEVPPEAELESPTWYEQVDPAGGTIDVTGQVFARGGSYTCEVLVAPGHYPNNATTSDAPPGDFEAVPAGGGACDGSTSHTGAVDGKLAEIDLAELQSRFPPEADFSGPGPIPTLATNNGRPNSDPQGFVVKVVATTDGGGVEFTGEDRRAAFLHRDQDMLDGFPSAIDGGGQIGGRGTVPTADGESSPAFADLDGDNRNELVFADDNGFVHALLPDGSELPGWPVRGDMPAFVSSHSGTTAYETGAVSDNLGGAMLSAVAIADANRDGVPEVYAADLEGKLYGWSSAGDRIFTEETEIEFSGKPLAAFENVRYEPGQSTFRRTQHGFIGSPVLADLDGDDGGRLEIVAASMDRHVYAWEANDSSPGSPGGASELPGYPVLVVDPAKVQSIDSATHAVTFTPGANSSQQGAIIVTPAVADLDADADTTGPDERPELVVGTNEEYDEPMNAGNFTTATFPPLSGTGLLGPGNSRLYALDAGGDSDSDPNPANAILAGWPFKVGIANRELLPVVGEGISGYPVIASVTCPSGGGGPKIGVLANNGPAYVLNANGTSCYGNDPTSGRANALESDFAPSAQQYDHPVLPAVGHPAFGDLGGPGLAFLSPAAGLSRALDVALPEYQNGQDFTAVWDASTSQFHAGFPAAVNDLQFLTGPSIGDLDGLPGEEVVEGTSSKDLAAFNPVGLPVNDRWPKVTTDWTVANPLIGSFGTLDTDANATKVVVGMTRSGYINAYETEAEACSRSSWPRFHHDNANSGDFSRDAALPGRPGAIAAEGDAIAFDAPGDDLLCGTADHYELVTSDNPIDESSFDQATPLAGAPDPEAAGRRQSFTASGAQRFVAIRAVDEQGNVGRVASLDLEAGGGAGPGPALPGQPPACANEIKGSGGGDKLTGTEGGDRINGRAGRDKIKGRAGDDCLKGGRGRDRVAGGEGDDVIKVRGGGRDRVNCGPGDDEVVASGRDRTRGCERVKD